VSRTIDPSEEAVGAGEASVALYRSTSIRQVILAGFFLVTLPLMVALVMALVAVDRLTVQGQRAITASVTAIDASRLLVEDVTAMERHSRQFHILHDDAIFRVYLERHRQFQRNAQLLSTQDAMAALRPRIEALIADERSIFGALREAIPGSARMGAIIGRFGPLSAEAHAILNDSSEAVSREAENIQQAATTTRQTLLWLALLLIALALVSAGVFTGLIVKPIKQINQAIRRLGDGEFSSDISVKGPDDLEHLGQRLDWLRRRLAQLEQQKINFLRHVSHELKTPLASIREGAGLLKDRVVGPLNPEQAEVTAILQKNGLQLQRLIEDLIAFSVADRFEPIRERYPVALDRLLRDLAQEQKLAAIAKQVSFDLDLGEVTILGDAEKLRVIFDNLLSNAVKYAPLQGKVTVILRSNDGHAVVDVYDDGPGIDADERERIFEAFYQGRAIAKGHIKGSGLGLSIAHEYVRAHHGAIEAMGAERGAHFRVTLPGAVALRPVRHAASAA
jgi:two-component system sensor histidine kinase GlrK